VCRAWGGCCTRKWPCCISACADGELAINMLLLLLLAIIIIIVIEAV
jgi:hypothetical protein